MWGGVCGGGCGRRGGGGGLLMMITSQGAASKYHLNSTGETQHGFEFIRVMQQKPTGKLYLHQSAWE